MRLLVLGGSGMAGHVFVRFFRADPAFEVLYTTRNTAEYGGLRLDVARLNSVSSLLHQVRPDVIVNATGILNQAAEDRPLEAYFVNGLLPHWLAHLADELGARLIHISSDCVFSGDRGSYTEADPPDGETVYARTKALGEINRPKHLTIRTSIIGPEIRPIGIGLLQWFMRQEGMVKGYEQVLWNGVTTLELAKAVRYAIDHPLIHGIVNLTAGETVSKLKLLQLFREHFRKPSLIIEPDSALKIDRTLLSTREDWNYEAPGYAVMLAELANWMRSS